jgi:eukaryotic-like serine/threonine-protein kinase
MSNSSHLESIFFAALEKPSLAERRAYLDEACAGDADLCVRVERMLAAQADAGSFLESPASPPCPGEGHLAATTAHRPIAEQPGTIIGPYKLLQQIGEGGMGVVFMAEQTEPIQRTVALKIIKPGMDTRQIIARFEAERQAVAMMDHPNIAKVLDAGTTDSGRPYFVMELVKGVPITKYCDDKHLPLRARLELFMQVCQAVQHAHQKGIIHRDIKPNNVLVAEYDNQAVPKVIDFGVARATAQKLTERTMFTEFGQVLGTIEYMSPEQSKFNQLDIDTRSDIYSLGVLLYELLAGSTPFEGKRLHEAAFDEMLRIIREEEPPKPSTRVSSIDTLPSIAANRQTEPARLSKQVRGELDWIVMKALEKDRGRRYETANGFAMDVQRYLADEPVQAGPPSATYRFRKFARRNKAALLTVVVVMAALVGGTTVSTWQAIRATRATRAEQQALRIAKANEQAATAEARKSALVATFMKNMLGGASPYGASGRDTSQLREIMDKTAERIGTDLKEQPEAEADLRSTLGQTYFTLLDYVKAEQMQRAALEIYRKLGANDETLGVATLRLGQTLRETTKLSEAETLCRESVEIYRRVAGNESVGMSFALATLGNVLSNQGRLGEAEAVIRQALDMRVKLLGSEHSSIASAQANLGGVCLRAHKYADAEAAFRKAIVIYKKNGDSHPLLALATAGLGRVLMEQNRFSEAEPFYLEALALHMKLFGPGHANVAHTRGSLVKVLSAQGKLAEAQQLEAEQTALEQKLHPDALAGLRKTGLTFTSHLVGGDTWDVNLDDQPIADLSSLRHEPISHLSLKRTNVSDLTPLRGLPLKTLAIGGSKVTDLGPLKGMPLESLQISGSNIADLHPLRGMPLRQLYMTNCAGITDLSPLENMTTLKRVILPPNAKSFEFLRAFSKLTRLSFEFDPVTKDPDRSAAEFWKQYDEDPKKMRSAAIKAPATTRANR